jgi:hypothetical protein
MHLRKQATVLISTVIILSLMSVLGSFMFKMMKNNNELGSLYEFDKDVYDLNKSEEKLLYKYMQELNSDYEYRLNNLNNENSNNNENIFLENFEKRIEDSSLEYHVDNDKIFLISKKDNNLIRKREIMYNFKDEKILLIPTYKFEDYTE